ncbi:hypothetical protein [Paraliobacillus sediminis]|uniref:hypothetical protein n=1 Tax=Paraliobacillus sediminis TaxID=1885916 RepID=UPI000E3BAD03|nr:hypothetical protein [Paraliobacillus sediminis]
MIESSFDTTTMKNIEVKKAAEFSGFHVYFTIDDQCFQLLMGAGDRLFIINIKHVFEEKAVCKLCSKKILPMPIGHQWCKFLQERKEVLLPFFKNEVELYQNSK